MSAFHLNQVTGGTGRVWDEGAPPTLLASELEYWGKFEAMRVAPTSFTGAMNDSGQGGMIWELLPDRTEASLPVRLPF